MIEINQVTLSGLLTRDPELRYMTNGNPVCNFTLANNRTYFKEGEKKQIVAFIDVVVFGKIAEVCNEYLEKASSVIVLGRIKQDTWESKAGEKRSKLKIEAATVQFVTFKKKEKAYSEEPTVASDSGDIPY